MFLMFSDLLLIFLCTKGLAALLNVMGMHVYLNFFDRNKAAQWENLAEPTIFTILGQDDV